MKLYTYQQMGGIDKLAVCQEDGQLYPFESYGLTFADMTDYIVSATAQQRDMLKHPQGAALDKAAITLRAPIPYPKQDVICLGINYHDHAVEAGRFNEEAFSQIPKAIYFSKRVSQATGDGDAIPAYEGLVDSLDYEAELGVILGKDAFQASEEQALEYVFGYTVINDVSARNLQTGHKQWYFGKSLDGYTPMGPCILTADEAGQPPELRIRSLVNGEVRQDSNTRNLMHGIAQIIAELSQGMTLKAGTIIATGTPSGVGMGMQPPCFLKKGDTVTCEIEKIGSITNTVV